MPSDLAPVCSFEHRLTVVLEGCLFEAQGLPYSKRSINVIYYWTKASMKKIKGQARVALRTPVVRRSSQAVSQRQRPRRPRGHALAPRKPDQAGPPSARGRARPPGTGSAGRGRRTTCPVGLRAAAPSGGRLSPLTATAAAAAVESVAAAAAAAAVAAD